MEILQFCFAIIDESLTMIDTMIDDLNYVVFQLLTMPLEPSNGNLQFCLAIIDESLT